MTQATVAVSPQPSPHANPLGPSTKNPVGPTTAQTTHDTIKSWTIDLRGAEAFMHMVLSLKQSIGSLVLSQRIPQNEWPLAGRRIHSDVASQRAGSVCFS